VGRVGDRRSRWLLAALGVLIVVVAHELISRLHLLPPGEFPPASVIAATLFQEIQGSIFWESLWGTVYGWAAGLALGTLIAIPIGMLLGASDLLYRSLRLIIEWLRPIPSVALIPLAILIFGSGQWTKVVLVTVAVFWPMLIQTLYGVQDVDPVARDCARSYGLGPMARVRHLILPSAAPYILTGLRIASAIALVVAVATELVIGTPGLGASINTAQLSGASAIQYAYIVATGMLGWALNALFLQLEKRVLFWHPSQRMGEGR
jgi:ABC-type nitrate/sulfonate/bicarbonate transport system permease component